MLELPQLGLPTPHSVSLSSVLVVQQAVTFNNTYVEMRIGDIPVRIPSVWFQNTLNPHNVREDSVSASVFRQ